MNDKKWVDDIEKLVVKFSKKHSFNYCKKKRELSASFEIGCFHTLLKFYENNYFELLPINLNKNSEFRYLTTPSGNPNNFSYVIAKKRNHEFEIRQQLKIYSNIDRKIAFSPDLAVVKRNTKIEVISSKDYANGKRPFYQVSSNDVIAIHECKSLPPFPELMVSFIGMYIIAHTWSNNKNSDIKPDKRKGEHLAPTMFIGGNAKAMHLKMIGAIEKNYPINIVVGMHKGSWNLLSENRELNKLTVSL